MFSFTKFTCAAFAVCLLHTTDATDIVYNATNPVSGCNIAHTNTDVVRLEEGSVNFTTCTTFSITAGLVYFEDNAFASTLNVDTCEPVLPIANAFDIFVDAVAVFGNNVFECANIKNVSITGDTVIGIMSFQSTYNLIAVNIQGNITSVTGGAFTGSGIQSFKAVGNALAITDGAFASTADLNTVVLTGTTAEVSAGAFAASGIQSFMAIGNALVISGGAFGDTGNLSIVEITGTISTIERGAFPSADKLTTVYLPDVNANISSSAFNTSTGQIDLPCNSSLYVTGADFVNCSTIVRTTPPSPSGSGTMDDRVVTTADSQSGKSSMSMGKKGKSKSSMSMGKKGKGKSSMSMGKKGSKGYSLNPTLNKIHSNSSMLQINVQSSASIGASLVGCIVLVAGVAVVAYKRQQKNAGFHMVASTTVEFPSESTPLV